MARPTHESSPKSPPHRGGDTGVGRHSKPTLVTSEKSPPLGGGDKGEGLHSKPTLVCCAYHFGYGPAAKLLHVARLLSGSDLRLVFLGTGVSYELASKSHLFHDVVLSQPHHASARSTVASATAMLSMMDRPYAALAIELGKPLYAADSLAWMRDRFMPEDRAAKRYWVQRFVDDDTSLAMIGPNAQAVGPIVGPWHERPAHVPNLQPSTLNLQHSPTVVNLGGCESPLGSAEEDPTYADFVLAGLGALEPDTILLAGEKCARHARENLPAPGLKVMSAPHNEALSIIGAAQRVFTSPGLTATYECFHAGVPTFFLPPQNYSQWWILKHLRTRGLATHSFHWEDLAPENENTVVERMPVATRTPLVYGAIRRFGTDPHAIRRLTNGVEAALEADPDALAHKQSAFFRSLGTSGAQTIADELRRDLCDAATV